MTTTSTPPQIWPTFIYDDARAAIDFLERAFGFEATLIVPNDADDTVIEHCQMRGPEGGGIMLGTANRPGNEYSQRPSGHSAAYVVTTEPDALFARAVDAGAEVFQPLEEQDYGSRSFSLKDPEGNIWSFGTYAGEG